MHSAGAEAGVAAAVQAIWERTKGKAVAQAEAVEAAITDLLIGGLEEARRAEAARDAHKLAGSLGTFGLRRGSELAREIELALAPEAPLTQADAPRLAEMVLALVRELESGPAPVVGADTPSGDGGQPLLLIAQGDRELAERLSAEAASRALGTVWAHDASEARAQARRRRPDAALLDLALDDDFAQSLSLISELTAMDPSVPVLVLAADAAVVDRVEVARRGGRGFLDASRGPARVIEAVTRELERRGAPDSTVLAVDDDPSILEALRALLEPEGAGVATLSDPLRFWDALQDISPDLVVLDVDMPDVNGIELCRAMRNDDRFGQVPVVFLTARTGAEVVGRVFAAGADDYVSKPIIGAELRSRIANRLERVRFYRELADRDSLTGVATRRKSEEVLERFLLMARRYGQPLSLAVLDLDNFKQVNDRLGHGAGDRVLRRLGQLLLECFRGEDVVGRWGGEEFVVGMYGMSREDGVTRLAQALETFRAPGADGDRTQGITFSAGVAQHAEDGTDVQALYRKADAALYEAKRAGRARVVPAGWRLDLDAMGPDVVIVEDDDALAELIVHSLETRGHRVLRLADGDEAASLLTGGTLRPPPSLVLLDVDLPGLDGLAVLRRLARTGSLGGTRVIMLTARAAEQEVLEALELGAFDHVAKPFSVPVLMQRVQRAVSA